MNRIYVIVDTQTGKLWESYKHRRAWNHRWTAAAAWTTRMGSIVNGRYDYKNRVRFREQDRYVLKEVNFNVGPETRQMISGVTLKAG